MHVALIIDSERLMREQSMLDRLSCGLIERGLQVTGILPEPTAPQHHTEACPVTVTSDIAVRMKVPPWMRRARARQVADAVGAAVPDVVHAVGDAAWTLALDVARLFDRPVTLDVWSAEQLRRIPPGRGASRVAGYVTPTEPLARAVRQRTEPDLVSLVPMGVLVPREGRRILADPDSSMTIAIIGSGQEAAGHRAMLTGLSRLINELPQIQACLELRGPNEHEIWRHARRLNLLGHVSTIVDAAMHRPLLTGCDVLVIPDRLGQIRSIVLEAMALGMPVVAADDPYQDILVDDDTALVVDQGNADEWTDKLRRVLTDADLARRLGDAARTTLARRNRPDDQVAGLATAFEQVLSGGAHAFRAGP